MAFAHGIAFSRSQFLAEHMDYNYNCNTVLIRPPFFPRAIPTYELLAEVKIFSFWPKTMD